MLLFQPNVSVSALRVAAYAPDTAQHSQTIRNAFLKQWIKKCAILRVGLPF